ncbi:hypothetical protein SynSYN20_01755 [Synechococcus sp. SYN20]|nr:hypothetical protein SynSYN20_01755 [Synechococcus sp. SYN20]
MTLIIAIALLRQIIYLLAKKTSIAPSDLPPNLKTVVTVPGNQRLK